MPGPPPPPPPMAPAPKKFVPAAPSSGGGDMRNALLGQIQKGAKLKKVTTVDKSGPLIAGKIADEPGKPSSRGPASTRTSPDTPTASPMKKPPGGFANLTEELQFKMTLKKNKNSPVKEATPVESKEPSPPASSKSFVNEIKSKQSVITAHQTPSQAPNPNLSDAIANKSTLFNKVAPSVGAAPTVLNPPKVINHGKPNLAPRPPPQLKLVTSGNNSSLNGDSNRKTVARHQSMKSPRSPPTALSPSGPFTSDNHFGTMRMNPSNQQRINDAINPSPVQKPVAQRPTNKPPPPPVPNRFPGTNLTNNHAKSTNALNLTTTNEQNLSAPRRLPNSGSSNNISSMDRSADVSDSSAPPLPPHRMSSQTQLRAPPTPVPVSNQAPPEVPRRHSSMRNSIENGANGKYPSPNPNQPITKLVVDLESRYALLFHNVSEFPQPRAFSNLEKSYPSRAAVRQGANGI